jgi:ubiquinone/menaquinone biosynthesis C-methylase UbiE
MHFICEDVSEFVVRQKQESFDIIIGTSSFQHIPSYRERLFLMKHFYRLLKYDGLLIMTNRALSKRFLKKHWKVMLRSFGTYLLSLGKSSRRDVLVPWTSRGKVFERYYHLFSLPELKKLMNFSGLKIEQLSYLDDTGKYSTDWKYARDSFLVAKKNPFLLHSSKN